MSVAQGTDIQYPVKRTKVSFNLDNNEADSQKDADPIPIVELKPFVQKVWRREKSLPGFYDKFDVSLDRSSPRSMSKSSRDGDALSEILSQSEAPISPAPRTSHSSQRGYRSPKILVYVNTFNDFNSQKEHINRLVEESGYRPKSRIHPAPDTRSPKHPKHSVSIIPGFITRDGRTKSTLTDISLGESTPKPYHMVSRSPDPMNYNRHQAMRVVGENIANDRDGKMSPKGVTPSRSLNSSWQSVRHGSPASVLYHNRPKPGKGYLRCKTPLYDHLDREGTLPSLMVTAPGLNSRANHKFGDKDSDDYMDINDAYERNYGHNIGGIENSLKLLSKHGKPTKVERHLSRELESSLSRLRKTKDLTPFEINPAELAKYYPQNQPFNPTHGEVMIRQGLKSNAPKRFRDSKRSRKGHKLLSQSTFESTQGILKKSFREIEHLDSYDHEVLDLYKNEGEENRERTLDTGMTDNELMVPHDTPRTGPESQLSQIKTTEDLMHERENGGGSMSDRKASTGRDSVVNTVHMNGVVRGTMDGGLAPQTLGVDASGRTFITSDMGAQTVAG